MNVPSEEDLCRTLNTSVYLLTKGLNGMYNGHAPFKHTQQLLSGNFVRDRSRVQKRFLKNKKQQVRIGILKKYWHKNRRPIVMSRAGLTIVKRPKNANFLKTVKNQRRRGIG